jgi:hypothetical protein
MSRQFTSAWKKPHSGPCCDQCARPIAQCRCIDEALQEVAEKAPKGRWTLTQTTIPPFDVESVKKQREEGSFIPESARPRVEVVTLGLPQDPRVIILLPRDYPKWEHMKEAVRAADHWQRAVEAAMTRRPLSLQDGRRSYPPPRTATGKKSVGRDRFFLEVRRRRREGAEYNEIVAEYCARVVSDLDATFKYLRAAGNEESEEWEREMHIAMSRWHESRARALAQQMESRPRLARPITKSYGPFGVGWRRLKERMKDWKGGRERLFPLGSEE